MAITKEIVQAKLDIVLRRAEESGRLETVISSGELHRLVGGYPGPDARMPVVCGVMYKSMGSDDVVLTAPPSGLGASVSIRYTFPRSSTRN